MLRNALAFATFAAALALAADRAQSIAVAAEQAPIEDLSADAWPFPEDEACYACVETCEYDEGMSDSECRWATCREAC